MSLKIVTALFILATSVNSYATVLTCHRLNDKTQAAVGTVSANLHLNLTTDVEASYYNWNKLPAGDYDLNDKSTVEAAINCRDAGPNAQIDLKQIENGVEVKIEVSCFQDPHVVTDNYELACTY